MYASFTWGLKTCSINQPFQSLRIKAFCLGYILYILRFCGVIAIRAFKERRLGGAGNLCGNNLMCGMVDLLTLLVSVGWCLPRSG